MGNNRTVKTPEKKKSFSVPAVARRMLVGRSTNNLVSKNIFCIDNQLQTLVYFSNKNSENSKTRNHT
jgi:hypothetical protein